MPDKYWDRIKAAYCKSVLPSHRRAEFEVKSRRGVAPVI